MKTFTKTVIQKEGPTYNARVVGVVNSSVAHVINMLTTQEGSLDFNLIKKVSLWEPKEDRTSVHVRYEMATTPSFEVDVILRVDGNNSKKIYFSSVDDTWVDMKGSWEVKPSYLFGTHVVLENTITVKSFWLKFIPLHGIIQSTAEGLFEDLNESGGIGFFKRILKKCCCCFWYGKNCSTVSPEQ